MTSMLGRGGPSPCAVSVQRTAEHLFMDGGDGTMTTYAEMLRDPRWQKKRLEVLEAAGWMCATCFDDETELHVHHLRYKWNTKPWDYGSDELMCLCKKCHSEETAAWTLLKDELMLLGVGAKTVAPLVAGYMLGYGFAEQGTGPLERAASIDEAMLRVGRMAGLIDRLPDDLLADVSAALDSATSELKRRIANFGKRQKVAVANA